MNKLRRHILQGIVFAYTALERHWFPVKIHPKPIGGKMLLFEMRGTTLGRAIYRVTSRRGGFEMGEVRWSNQWGRARFKPHSEAVFDQQCIAEIYACMREMK